jgi:hypothetical protein
MMDRLARVAFVSIGTSLKCVFIQPIQEYSPVEGNTEFWAPTGLGPKRPPMLAMGQSRPWMYGDRHTSEYIEGLRNFSDVARANIQNGFMCCSCVDCENKNEYSSWKIRHSHLLWKGFMSTYNC